MKDAKMRRCAGRRSMCDKFRHLQNLKIGFRRAVRPATQFITYLLYFIQDSSSFGRSVVRSFVVRRSSFVVRRSSFVVRRSSFVVQHANLVIQ